ncbi:MAG: polysaccharide biosynthesis/export family protein [Bryobacteraceae bacterium]|nr:polysaccharide biosynthesis/export family protein [Bryobacteraceae bacterium]
MMRWYALLFAAVPLVAQPRLGRPVPVVEAVNLPAGRIGPNDLLAVSVYEAPELTRSVRVGADGTIRLPMLKRRIVAAGRLPSEVEEAIAQALRAEELLVDPIVTVTILEYHSRPVRVAGAVRHPVTFQVEGTVTLLDALTRAGGLSPEAGPEILVSRAQIAEDGSTVTQVQRIPVKGLIDAADPELNIPLVGGEEIRVPEAGRVYVAGSVRKPGSFPIRDSAEISVLQLLALAEGLAPFASQTAYVYRLDPATGSRQEIPIELKKILDRKAPDVALVANDLLYVPDSSGRRITVRTLERIAGFGATTASGILIWRR